MWVQSMLYKDARYIVEYVGKGCKTGLEGGDHPPVCLRIRPAPGSKGPSSPIGSSASTIRRELD